LIKAIPGRRLKEMNVINGTLIIEPDLDLVNKKKFIAAEVRSKYCWNKGLFKIRFKFPLNDKNVWSTIYFYGSEAYIDFLSQESEKAFSQIVKSGVRIRWNNEEIQNKYIPQNNMSDNFNEVVMDWDNERIVWTINDQFIHTVNLKRFFQFDDKILYEKEGQPFDKPFELVMAITMREEFYDHKNFDLKNLYNPYFHIDYIRVYQWRDSQNVKYYCNNGYIIIIAISVSFVIVLLIIIIYFKLKIKRIINSNTPESEINNYEIYSYPTNDLHNIYLDILQ
jgi:beta-glucanase (GH16 family)